MTDNRGTWCCVKGSYNVIAKITEMKKQKRKGCVLAIWLPEKFADFHFETIDFGS